MMSDPLARVAQLARDLFHAQPPGSSDGLLEAIRAEVKEQKHQLEVVRRWVDLVDRNEGTRARNRELEEELESLRIASVAQDAKIPSCRRRGMTAHDYLARHENLTRRVSPELTAYQVGRDLEEMEPAEAKALYDLCQSTPTPASLHLLGWCHRLGLGTPQDMKEAISWYQKSAELGNSFAMKDLGTLHHDRIKGTTDANTDVALSWFRRSAELGNGSGMNRVALCLEFGTGTPRDLCGAFSWYQKSADAGLPVGMYHLATCYRDAIGTTRDETKAFEWFLKSAHAGDSDAMGEVANRYRRGVVVPQDDAKALEWSSKCANADNPVGRIEMARRLWGGIGVPRDDFMALQHIYRAYRFLERIKQWLVDVPLMMWPLLSQIFEERPIELVERWIREEDETRMLETHEQELTTEIEALRTHLEYWPGGPGYTSAWHDFETLAGPGAPTKN